MAAASSVARSALTTSGCTPRISPASLGTARTHERRRSGVAVAVAGPAVRARGVAVAVLAWVATTSASAVVNRGWSCAVVTSTVTGSAKPQCAWPRAPTTSPVSSPWPASPGCTTKRSPDTTMVGSRDRGAGRVQGGQGGRGGGLVHLHHRHDLARGGRGQRGHGGVAVEGDAQVRSRAGQGAVAGVERDGAGGQRGGQVGHHRGQLGVAEARHVPARQGHLVVVAEAGHHDDRGDDRGHHQDDGRDETGGRSGGHGRTVSRRGAARVAESAARQVRSGAGRRGWTLSRSAPRGGWCRAARPRGPGGSRRTTGWRSRPGTRVAAGSGR